MKTSITDFQRNLRKAREAADRGDSVIVTGENGDYVFECRISRNGPARFLLIGPTLHGLPAEPLATTFTRPFFAKQVSWL